MAGPSMHELVDGVRRGGGLPVLVEKKTPVFDAELVRGFFVLALGSGFVVFVGSGLMVWALTWSVKVALGLAGCVILATWSAFLWRVWGSWFATETVRPPDLPAFAQPIRQGIAVEVSRPDAKQMQFLDLPGNAEQLCSLASGVLAGRTLAEDEWTGAGRPYSKSEFRELRGELLERGLLCWRNERAPSQGVELTRVGAAVFRGIVEQTRTHAHARGGGQFAAVLEAGQGRVTGGDEYDG